MIDHERLASAFRNRYGGQPRLFRAPGRVNLIGEHTDYNEGYVLPMAIDRETVVAIASRPGRILRVHSQNLGEELRIDLDCLGPGRRGSWSDYVAGVAAALEHQGIGLAGADIEILGDVGLGSGLASSASLEVALGMALAAVSGAAASSLALALAGQTAEHVHVGISSGIMDQFVSAHALAGHALLLDCRSLGSRNIPLRLDGWEIVVCDSRVRHALAFSEYNRRRSDCQEAVRILGLRSLRDLDPAELAARSALLPDKILRRCRHVVTENRRTLAAAEALAAGSIREVGRLMLASHQSLRDDYEVSCRELDWLVEIAARQPGTSGARVTGGGFGGCTVNLVPAGSVDLFRESVAREYGLRAQSLPDIFVVRPSNGASEIPM